MTFNKEQIRTGKQLRNWLKSQGLQLDKARLEAYYILKHYELKRVKWAMQQPQSKTIKGFRLTLDPNYPHERNKQKK